MCRLHVLSTLNWLLQFEFELSGIGGFCRNRYPRCVSVAGFIARISPDTIPERTATPATAAVAVVSSVTLPE